MIIDTDRILATLDETWLPVTAGEQPHEGDEQPRLEDDPPPTALTAAQIARATGMELTAVLRGLLSLQRRGLAGIDSSEGMVRIDRVAWITDAGHRAVIAAKT